MDGARLMNASIAMNVPPARLVRDCASVSLCLSKGLGAPVGSVIAGSKSFIERARRLRKALGGGVRQPSILAAAGIYGLDHVPKLLEADHRHAKAIAQAVSNLKSPLVSVNIADVHTNIVLLECDMRTVFPAHLCARMQTVTEEEAFALGHRIVIKSFSMAKTSVRLVLYYNITPEDVELAIKKLTFVIREYNRVI
ncbi:putative low-specificity L-threonine aldolase 1 [Halocaridina rubra]|uniref:Low-specificity L-threonine aldolase 1 n=1 Tax=Halocaridina rubra TaxID=373956 RepID=A0AAN9AH52_HALRR